MNGREIKEARARLGLTQAELSGILSVDPKTIVRWESSVAARIDPLFRQLVMRVIGIAAKPNPYDLGLKLKEALTLGGATFALHILLNIVYNDWRSDGSET